MTEDNLGKPKARTRSLFAAKAQGVVSRLFHIIDKYQYAPLGAAFAAAFTVFAAGTTLCTAIGIAGSATVFLTLGLMSLATLTVVHGALMHRRRAQLEAAAKPVPAFEVRKELDQILPTVDPQVAAALQRIVGQYEIQIQQFQDEVARLTNREIPGKPVIIEAGPFQMGANDSEPDESPQHSVYVSAFFIDAYPVTNRQFADFISDPANKDWLPRAVYDRYGIPYYLVDWDDVVPPTGRWDHPVVNVSWFAAVAFCNWRSERDGKAPIYSFSDDFHVTSEFACDGWRLPTEAEWEKAARGGKQGLMFPWEGHLAPTRANYGKHYRGTTPVGQFPANEFGLFDLLGNVKEWCHDNYSSTTFSERSEQQVKDPASANDDTFRVFRGGSWMDRAEWIHLSKRGRMYPQNVNPDFGFRCVRRP